MNTTSPATAQECARSPESNKEQPSASVPSASPSVVASAESTIEWVEIGSIKTGEAFSGLFLRSSVTVDALTASMRQRGFDPAHPLVLWKENGCLIIGHTRHAAALACKLERVPVIRRSFASEDAAIDAAIDDEVHRRRLTNEDKLRLVLLLDKRGTRGGDRRNDKAGQVNAVGRTAQATADKIGVSASTVERIRRINDADDESIAERILSGELTIAGACKLLRRQRSRAMTMKTPRDTAKIKKIITQLRCAEKVIRRDQADVAERLAKLVDDIKTWMDKNAADMKTAAKRRACKPPKRNKRPASARHKARRSKQSGKGMR